MEGVAGMPVLHSTAQPVMALLPPFRLTMQRPRDSWLGSADRHAPLTEHVGCMVVAVRQACLPMQAGAAATATRLAATFPDVPAANGYAPCLGAACIALSVISAIFFFYY